MTTNDRRVRRACAGLLVLLAACGEASPGPFTAWPHALAPMVSGRPRSPTILEVNGGGAAFFDADEDGDMDLLLVIPGEWPGAGAPEATGGRSNRLYRNDGGELIDVTPGSGVDVAGWCNGVAVGDVDGDGRRDIYLTRLGPNVLLRNLGALRFEVVPDAAGAAGSTDEWSTSAVFSDIDRDGDLDLYVVNYLRFDPADPPEHGRQGRSCTWLGHVVMCGPQGLPAQADRLYLNEGGRLTDVTVERGVTAPAAYGLGVIDGDWNDDGWPDLYVSNDSMPNHLYLNRGEGRFEEAGVLAGAALSSAGREQAGMGIAAGDVDGDLDEDLLVTNFSMESNAFYLNVGGGRFREQADAVGLGGPSRAMLGWGAAFLDVDLDGQLELLTANGHVYPQADAPDTGTSWAQADLLWRNGPQGWAPVPWAGTEPAVSRALAVADLDDDGVSDVLVLPLAGAPRLWRGVARGRSSLSVALQGPPGNPDALGARVLWRDAQGARVRFVRNSAGYQACSDPRPIFGWRGPGTLEITWPDGSASARAVPAPGRLTVPREAP